MNVNEETSQVNETVDTQATEQDSKMKPSEDVESTKTYTQEQLDAIAADIRRKSEVKISKKFEGIDVEKYREMLDKEEKIELEKQKKKGEFDSILKQQAEKFGSKINTLTSELTKIKVDGALLNAASTKKAISPEQVVRLVRDQVKMSENGEVEVVDKNGTVRYSDTGTAMTVDGLVGEFLKTNPHFVQAGLAGGGSKSNVSPNTNTSDVDINTLDLENPEQLALYRELRKKKYPDLNI